MSQRRSQPVLLQHGEQRRGWMDEDPEVLALESEPEVVAAMIKRETTFRGGWLKTTIRRACWATAARRRS